MKQVSMTSPVAGITVIEVLGHGGFSVVYRGRQESVGREVALKVDNRMAKDERDRRRFLREAHAAGQLSDHPNVISVFDAGITEDGRPYLVMELCPGGSLADRLRRDGPLPAADVREVGVRIADALEAAHQAGVLHRDLKPANILVNRFNSPGLADFGLAASHDPTRQLSATLEALTPAYAAPEMFRMDRPTVAVDVYGLGATLYSLLSGRPPRWPAEGYPSIATIIDLQNEPVPNLPGVPSALVAVLRKALANDPADRYPSAAALRDALSGVALDAPTGLFTAIPADDPAAPTAPISNGQAPATPSVRGSASVTGSWGVVPPPASPAVSPAVAAPSIRGSASIPPRANPQAAPPTAVQAAPVSPAAAAPQAAPTRVAPAVPAPPPARPTPPPPPGGKKPPKKRKRRWPLVLTALFLAGTCGIGSTAIGLEWLRDRANQTNDFTDPNGVDTGVIDQPADDGEVVPPQDQPTPSKSPSKASPTPPPYETADPSTITSIGLGPFKVDEPVRPLLNAGVAARPGGGEGPCDADTQLVSTRDRYADVVAGQDGKLISHVTIRSENFKTRSGLKVGTSEDTVRGLDNVQEATDPDAETKAFLVKDGGNGLLFVVNEGAVTTIVVGRWSKVTAAAQVVPGAIC